MKPHKKAYLITVVSYVPVFWVMSQIWWSYDFKNCESGPIDCTGVQCELIGASAPICSPTILAWILLILLALLPVASLLLWKRFRKH